MEDQSTEAPPEEEDEEQQQQQQLENLIINFDPNFALPLLLLPKDIRNL